MTQSGVQVSARPATCMPCPRRAHRAPDDGSRSSPAAESGIAVVAA
jgi:hypothetical protein